MTDGDRGVRRVVGERGCRSDRGGGLRRRNWRGSSFAKSGCGSLCRFLLIQSVDAVL
jgi:hypothetical protein